MDRRFSVLQSLGKGFVFSLAAQFMHGVDTPDTEHISDHIIDFFRIVFQNHVLYSGNQILISRWTAQ